MRRLIRSIQHRILILLGKADIRYDDIPFEGMLPQEWISDKLMDNDYMLYNAGFSKKYKGYLVIAQPLENIKQV